MEPHPEPHVTQNMTMNAQEVLDREYLELRSRILDVAASLDRIQRASGSVAEDSRSQLIAKAMEVLSGSELHRAEKIQLLFSREYNKKWQDDFAVNTRS